MTTFRMIKFRYFDAYMNMALDEAIMEAIRNGKSLPTIRFYGWKPSAVSIGIFQALRNEVNLDAAKTAGVDVIRRQTGGGAVYHDNLGEVTYSIIGPLSMFPQNVLKSYELLCADIISSLQSLGIDARFVNINDVLVEEQKISGSAQTRRNGILLQHGTILYDLDVEKMFNLLNVSQEKVSDKAVKSVKKRVTCVKDHGNASLEDLILSMETGFSKNRDVEFGDYSDWEYDRARQLAVEKYRSDAWNFKL